MNWFWNRTPEESPTLRIAKLSDEDFVKLLREFGKQESFLVTCAAKRAANMITFQKNTIKILEERLQPMRGLN